MSGGILISFVDFAAFSFEFDRVRCGSFGLILVRNWCGSQLVINPPHLFRPMVLPLPDEKRTSSA
jgi:hypothetical protein